MTNQQTKQKAIELLFAKLMKHGNVDEFTKTIQQNVDTKRLSSNDKTDFYDRLMLNIAYYVENKKAWEKIVRKLLSERMEVKRNALESQVLQEQMVIREEIATKMDEYKTIFHNQYKALPITDEDVIYDYAYASVEHSIRFDFLTYFISHPDWTSYIMDDVNEMVRLIDGYVAYYADQFVNQMDLK